MMEHYWVLYKKSIFLYNLIMLTFYSEWLEEWTVVVSTTETE